LDVLLNKKSLIEGRRVNTRRSFYFGDDGD